MNSMEFWKVFFTLPMLCLDIFLKPYSYLLIFYSMVSDFVFIDFLCMSQYLCTFLVLFLWIFSFVV